MEDKDKLKQYSTKRDFRKTTEPADNKQIDSDNPIFVIQKHDASNLHYDFRLEIEGVLKSWAVPKGLSTNPSEKRLAVATEDHPLEYSNFEGYIPEDNYGAGTVMIWDRGNYVNLRESKDEKSMKQSMEDGKVEVRLEGEKLKGGYVLIHTKSPRDNTWLIKKIDDKEADARRKPVNTEPESVVTGRSLEEIEEEDKQ